MNINSTSTLENKSLEMTRVSEIISPVNGETCVLPLFLESVSAGFPSPADDYLERTLDLNDYLIQNPSSTFFLRVTGDSMIDAGIFSGDMLVVDRSITAKDGHIVIAVINGELIVKRLHKYLDEVYLHSENKNYKPIKITSEMQFDVWGVVTTVIHSVV